jgi:hypothetical protein
MSNPQGKFTDHGRILDRNPLLRANWAITDALNPLIVPTEASLEERWTKNHEEWSALSQETWYLNQELEPLNHSGHSILDLWLNSFETKERKWWQCRVPLSEGTWCTKEINRKDRAIIHVRGHLGLNPFPCGGKCGNIDWYGTSSPIQVL